MPFMNTSNPDREPLNIEGKVCRADILISLRDTTWIGDEKTSLDQLSQVIRVMKDDSVFKEQLEQGFIQIPADYKEKTKRMRFLSSRGFDTYIIRDLVGA